MIGRLRHLRPDWSFSKAPLTKKCRHFLKPGVPWNDGPDTPARSGGRRVHRSLAVLTNDGVVEQLEDATLAAMYAIARNWLVNESGYFKPASPETLCARPDGLAPSLDLRAEVAFAYDLETGIGRELVDPPGETNPRWYADEELREKYGIKKSETCGRVDLVCRGWDNLGTFACVDDWKFHSGPGYQSAAEQLKVCARAVGSAYNVDRVRVRAIHVWDDGDPLVELVDDLLELGELELDRTGAWLEDLAEDTDSEPKDGPHCVALHCPAILTCPKTQRAANEFVDLVPPDRLARGKHSIANPITTNEEAAWTLTALEQVEKLLAAKWAQANAFADATGGILREGNLKYSGEIQNPESVNLNAPGAMEVLEAFDLELAVKKSVVWKDIKTLGGAEGERKAREAFRACGALKAGAPRTVYDTRPMDAGAGKKKRAS